jgi:hypothetical protein
MVRRLALLPPPHFHSLSDDDLCAAIRRMGEWQFPHAEVVEISPDLLFLAPITIMPVIGRSSQRLTAAAIPHKPLKELLRMTMSTGPYEDLLAQGHAERYDDAEPDGGQLLPVLRELGRCPELVTLTIEAPLSLETVHSLAVGVSIENTLSDASAPAAEVLTSTQDDEETDEFGTNRASNALLFPKLCDLSVRVWAHSLDALFASALAVNIRHIDLTFLPCRGAPRIFTELMTLSQNLTSLCVTTTSPLALGTADFQTLADLCSLREFRLRDGHKLRTSVLELDGRCLTDARLRELLAHWPHLEQLELQCLFSLSMSSLNVIGRFCRQLRVLQLEEGRCNMKELGRGLSAAGLGQQPLFPELTTLLLASAGRDATFDE